MVYRGKPSQGCLTCRQRKIRCDQRVGGCANCEKYKQECPGYRDQKDLLFLDESANVKGKADAKRAAAGRSRTPSSRTSESRRREPSGTRSSSYDTAGWTTLELEGGGESSGHLNHPSNFNLNDCATAFFLTHYAVKDSPSDARIRSLTDGITGIGADALLNAIHTLGLAGLARFHSDPDLMGQARRRYLTAIQKTNLALTSPDQVTEDSTLLAVMLLSFVEATIGGNEQTLTAWSNHAHGAAILLSMRGPGQFTSSERMILFMQAVLSLTSSCLQKSITMPEQIPILVATASQYVESSDTSWQYFETFVSLTDFVVRARKKLIQDPHVILTRATELDDIFASMLDQPDLGWGYRIVTDPMVPLGYYYMYETYFGAQIWNGVRTARIILNKMKRMVLLAGFSSQPPTFHGPEFHETFQSSTDLLYRLQDETIASIPQHMGLSDSSGYKTLWSDFISMRVTPQNKLTSAHSSLPMMRSAGGYSFIWLLYLVGKSPTATEDIQKMMIKALHDLGEKKSVQQAIVLSESLDRRLNLAGRVED